MPPAANKRAVIEMLDAFNTGNTDIVGLMLESNLFPGNQKLTADPSLLHYGVSITDGCIGWDETESLIRDAHAKLQR